MLRTSLIISFILCTPLWVLADIWPTNFLNTSEPERMCQNYIDTYYGDTITAFVEPTGGALVRLEVPDGDLCTMTFPAESLYAVGGSLSVDCRGALMPIQDIDNSFRVTTDTVNAQDDTIATKLILINSDPPNNLFGDSLQYDIIKAIAWVEYAGSNDPTHCHNPYNPRWNNYWDHVISGGDTCIETRFPCENTMSTATGTMQILRGTWERVFNGSELLEPPGFYACKWDSLAWSWKINVFNGKYIHQVSMFSHMSPIQNSWDSLYFPQSDYTPDIPNREDLATYGYKEGATEMSKIKDLETWNEKVRDNYYINRARKFKDIRPWEN